MQRSVGNWVNKGRVSENTPFLGNLVKEEREEDRPPRRSPRSPYLPRPLLTHPPRAHSRWTRPLHTIGPSSSPSVLLLLLQFFFFSSSFCWSCFWSFSSSF